MSRFRVSIHIVPRKGILDPQGKAVADALHSLGFASVAAARHRPPQGHDATPADAARGEVRTMCDRLLANPVTEDFEIAAVEDAR
jgi:phosphoribosylformylglycinamidine synthase PurS subunit